MPWLTNIRPQSRHHMRSPTFPLYHSSRKKPRRWPLVLRVIKGSIHADIAIPVILHAAIACLICWLDDVKAGHFGLPSSTIPSLSIVVGLMLVFRNQTSYDRFWQGNNHLTNMVTCIRNLSRNFLTNSYATAKSPPTDSERADTERTVRILLAMIFAAKNHLRAEWGQTLPMLLPSHELERRRRESRSTSKAEYSDLLPAGTRGFEEQGLGLLQQLSIQIDAYIKRGEGRSWWSAPQASQMSAQLNLLVQTYGNMETIHLTPLPVALLIHMRQVLALFCCVLPFALVEDMGWWTVLMVVFISFTLYGIEAIGCQLEDPFGYDKNDIKVCEPSSQISRSTNITQVDAIAEDLRVEVGVMIEEWRRNGTMFKVM